MNVKKKLTDIILAVVSGGIVIFDIIVAITKSWDATISRRILVLSGKYPLIAVAWGVLASHFFLSKLGRKLFSKLGNIRMYIWISIASMLLILCVINLFTPIAFIVFLCNNRWLSLIIGMALGLFWFQEKEIKNG